MASSCAQSLAPPGPGDAHVDDDLGAPADLADDLAAPDLAGCGDCDDQVACTVDSCDPATRMCAHQIDHSLCAVDELCTQAGCVKADQTKVCTPCASTAECGADEVCGAATPGDAGMPPGDAGAGGFCLPVCAAGAGCPKGFGCDPSASPPRCLPAGGACCFDVDADHHGVGAGCLGSDCDDKDPAVYAGNAEVCDGKDNDCNGTVDEGNLCGAPSCAQAGATSTFAAIPLGACVLGACSAPGAVSCGRYTCMPVSVPLVGSACRSQCSGVDDTACTGDSYCDGSGCVSQLPDGTPCGRDRMCGGGHCQNGFCCASGDCCSNAPSCPASYGVAAACDAPATACQGHRLDKTCTQNICGSVSASDDSACGAAITISCGNFPSQSCNATANQAPLACPTACAADRECVPSAYCNGTVCTGRVPDGGLCGASNECLIGRSCLNGHCCGATTGSCCGQAADCPAGFAAAASCDAPLGQCQGHRIDKTCVSFVCGSQNVPDDTACGSSITLDCSAQGFPNQACNAASSQNPLACPTTCASDGACTAGSWCQGAPAGTCVARQPPGGACSGSNQCQAGLSCLNNFCCSAASGSCCSVAANCPAGFAAPAVCDAPNTSCQGHRLDKACVSSICSSANTPDDSACGAPISIGCGLYPTQACNGGLNQAPLSCPSSCLGDGNCAANAYCAGGVCVARAPDGGSCSAGNQCQAGRSCLNSHCCSAASGSCCGIATDCPASFASAPVCDAPNTSCQGHRFDKACTNFICGSASQSDDSACGPAISVACGRYLPVACSGSASQSPLSCPTSCASDGACVQPANHCLAGQCVPWVENGGSCASTNQCRSGFCVSGICCDSACNATTCDACSTGTCNPFVDPWEAGNMCLSALPDLGSGVVSGSLTPYIQASTDTSDWYQMNLSDPNTSDCTGHINVTLNGPAGTDYDVYLYYAGPGGACNGTQVDFSDLTTYPDTIHYTESGCPHDYSGWYFIEVRRWQGQSCTQPYTLTVDARL